MSPSIQPVCRHWAGIKWSPESLKGTLILLINCAPLRSRMHKLAGICTSSQLFWVRPDREQTGPTYTRSWWESFCFLGKCECSQMKESYFHFSCTSEWESTEEEVRPPAGNSDALWITHDGRFHESVCARARFKVILTCWRNLSFHILNEISFIDFISHRSARVVLATGRLGFW